MHSLDEMKIKVDLFFNNDMPLQRNVQKLIYSLARKCNHNLFFVLTEMLTGD